MVMGTRAVGEGVGLEEGTVEEVAEVVGVVLDLEEGVVDDGG